MSYAMKSGFYEFGMKEEHPIKTLNLLLKYYYAICQPTMAITIMAIVLWCSFDFPMIFLLFSHEFPIIWLEKATTCQQMQEKCNKHEDRMQYVRKVTERLALGTE